MANVHHFIRTLPDGYHSVINEEANNIHRRKQLLTIARAILKDPQILILDEATSSVDTRLEKCCRKRCTVWRKNKLCHCAPFVHHTQCRSDSGDQRWRYRRTGTHEELMEKQGYYEKLYNSQFADKE